MTTYFLKLAIHADKEIPCAMIKSCHLLPSINLESQSDIYTVINTSEHF